MFPSAEHGSFSLQGFIHMMCAPQSQSPDLRPFEELNILHEPRGPESGIILKNWSGDCFVNVCHLLLRCFMKHRLVIPVFLFTLLHIDSMWFLGIRFELTGRPRSFCCFTT